MTIKTKTTTVESVEVQVRLDEILAEVFAKNPELKDGFTRTNSTLAGGPSDRVLLVTFGRRTETETELEAAKPADDLPQRREIVRAALGTASTFYTGATPEDRAKVEEAIITAWKDSGTSDALSEFALPYYRANLRDWYNTTSGRFEFAERAKDQREAARAILDSLGRTSYETATEEVKELIVTRLLDAVRDGDVSAVEYGPVRSWYIGKIYPEYQRNGDKFPFAPWQPTAEQIAEARDILGIRIPFGQLSEDDKSTAVLEVLRKWHEDGEKDTLRNSRLYENYFRGSELYLTTEFGKQNQGRI